MKVELKTQRYFTCPNGCAHRMTVEHLLTPGDSCAVTKDYPKRTAGPWYCDDCGHAWAIEYDADSIEVTPAKNGQKKITDWVILELPPQTEPVRFKVRGMRFEDKIDEEARRYYYEEHTCPTNWLRDVEEVAVGADTDPHGLWNLVAVYDADAENAADAALLGPASPDGGKENG